MRTLCPRMHPPDVSMCMPSAANAHSAFGQQCGRVVWCSGPVATSPQCLRSVPWLLWSPPPRRAGVLNWTGLDCATAAHPATAHSGLHRRTGGVTGRHGASAGGAGRAGLYGLYPRNLMVGVSPASPSCISGGPIFWGLNFPSAPSASKKFFLAQVLWLVGGPPRHYFLAKILIFYFFLKN